MKRLILSLAPLTLAAGCATVPAQTGTTAFSEAIPHDITAGQARLAVQLYPKLAEAAEPNDNLFISPLSLSEGLGLALPGARGQTEAEMRDLLGWDAASRPELLVKDAVEDGRLEALAGPEPGRRAYWLVAPTPQWRTRKVKSLADFLSA